MSIQSEFQSNWKSIKHAVKEVKKAASTRGSSYKKEMGPYLKKKK
tara:strand:+ start:1817 stop:1951 length:135 start_codon:yes stop_codon:yes gene_type:complete